MLGPALGHAGRQEELAGGRRRVVLYDRDWLGAEVPGGLGRRGRPGRGRRLGRPGAP